MPLAGTLAIPAADIIREVVIYDSWLSPPKESVKRET
jgi:hypothetical protein